MALIAVWAGGAPARAAGTDTIEIVSASGVHPFSVELAANEADRERGLMYRKSLPEGRGMLFDFGYPQSTAFWMHNTYIPLDMIFFTEDRRILYIEENAEPLTDVSRGPEAWSQFVLEVPGGWSRAHGIEPGTIARFVDVR